jgi:hypothetical protein
MPGQVSGGQKSASGRKGQANDRVQAVQLPVFAGQGGAIGWQVKEIAQTRTEPRFAAPMPGLCLDLVLPRLGEVVALAEADEIVQVRVRSCADAVEFIGRKLHDREIFYRI